MGLRDGGPERRRHLSANRLCASVVGKRGHGRGGCRTTRVSQAIVLQWNKGRRADAIHHQDQRGCLAGRNFVAWPLSPFVVGGKDKAAALFERSAPLRMSKRCRASGARLAHRPALTPQVPAFPHDQDPQRTNRLIGAGEQRRRYRAAERLRSLEIDHKLELGRLLNRRLGRFGAFQDLFSKAAQRRVRSGMLGPYEVNPPSSTYSPAFHLAGRARSAANAMICRRQVLNMARQDDHGAGAGPLHGGEAPANASRPPT